MKKMEDQQKKLEESKKQMEIIESQKREQTDFDDKAKYDEQSYKEKELLHQQI